MKLFQYKIKDEVGIHARPAGLLVKLAKETGSTVRVANGEKDADATKLFALMGLGVRQGDEVTVTVEGGDEDGAMERVKAFFENEL